MGCSTGFDAGRAEGGAETPAEHWQEPRCVGRDLDSHTYVAQHSSRLEQRDPMTSLCERVGRREATDACADDDDDVEAEGRTVATIERRQLVQEYVCGWFYGLAWMAHDKGEKGKPVRRINGATVDRAAAIGVERKKKEESRKQGRRTKDEDEHGRRFHE